MDYNEEQSTEIEALESIYPSELNMISSEPPYAFSIYIKSEAYENSEGNDGYCCTLKIIFTEKYPESVPLVEIVGEDEENPASPDETNLEDDDITDLKSLIVSTAGENTGMAMVFTLVTAALEWMNELWDKRIKDKEEAEERKIREAEEAEMKRFEGTRVTEETFAVWKASFDLEMAMLNKDKDSEKDKENRRLTGRELFLKDKTLGASDLKFVEEGEVPIDESLFDDLDDLDLDDDDEDDPDFDPDDSDQD